MHAAYPGDQAPARVVRWKSAGSSRLGLPSAAPWLTLWTLSARVPPPLHRRWDQLCPSSAVVKRDRVKERDTAVFNGRFGVLRAGRKAVGGLWVCSRTERETDYLTLIRKNSTFVSSIYVMKYIFTYVLYFTKSTMLPSYSGLACLPYYCKKII